MQSFSEAPDVRNVYFINTFVKESAMLPVIDAKLAGPFLAVFHQYFLHHPPYLSYISALIDY